MARPNFTAYVVILTLTALKRDARWGALIPDEAANVARACLEECSRGNAFFRLLKSFPAWFSFGLLNRMVVWGFPLHVALRKREIERLARAEIAAGCSQMAVIGAGFDALALRLAREFPHLRFFELDLQGTQEAKRAALGRHAINLPANLHFIPCDLSRMPLREALAQSPEFRAGAPTLFIAEGLTMYLSDADNRAWLSDCAKAAKDARVIFSAIGNLHRAGDVGSALRDKILNRRGERFTWAINPEEVPDFVGGCGFVHCESHMYLDMQRAILTGEEFDILQRRLKKSQGEHIYIAKTPTLC